MLSYIPLTTIVLSELSFMAFRSWLSFLQSSSPLHLWSSNIRCLPQKCPEQNPQSPMIRCAGSLQSLNVQRSFLGGMPPRIGSVSSSVELEDMFKADIVGSEMVVVRWRPA